MKTTKKSAVAEYLTRTIDASGKTQREIALEIGYENPNVITMFKQGHTKLPLNTVGPIAKALGIDPAYLLRLVMSEYFPDTYHAVEECLGTMLLTERERALITECRRRTGDSDPKVIFINEKKIFALAIA